MNADLIIHNAKVYTVDDENPHAEAVAVRDNKIIFVGDNAGALALSGANTRVIDGAGRSLLPGFIDAHFHLQWGAKTLVAAQLYEAKTVDDLISAVSQWKSQNPTADWVIGEGINYAIPSADIPLTRHILDQIESEKPLAFTAYDQHTTFVNSVALARLGLTNGYDGDMANGEIPVDADGLATGELYEMDAMAFVQRAMPELTAEQELAITKKALAACAEQGITTVHNMDGDFVQGQHYATLDEMGDLSLRVYLPFWMKPDMDMAFMLEQSVKMRNAFRSDKLYSGAVKFFMDGVYESFTAVTLGAYPEQPDNFGEPIWSPERFAEFVTAIDKLGMQLATHACGDGAVQRVLDGYESAQKTNGVRDSRHRVEHIEMIAKSDIPRFAQLGIVPSFQPLHSPIVAGDYDVWQDRVWRMDYDRAFAWRDLRDTGATLPFGSDWPVVTLSALLGIWGAVNRDPLSAGTKDQSQTLAETIASYTRDAAWVGFHEGKTGQIKEGLLADLVLLSDNIFTTPPADIKAMTVTLTICDGQIVHEK